jgi:hypothetical protein
LNDGNPITVTVTKETKTHYDYEIEQNEEKRKIKLLKPEFISAIENEIKTIFG